MNSVKPTNSTCPLETAACGKVDTSQTGYLGQTGLPSSANPRGHPLVHPHELELGVDPTKADTNPNGIIVHAPRGASIRAPSNLLFL